MAQAGSPANDACTTVDKLFLTEPFTKKQRQRIVVAARSIRRVEDRSAKTIGTRLRVANSDKKRAAALAEAFSWCDEYGFYGTPSAGPTPTTPTLPPTPKIGSTVTGTNGTITVYGLEFPVVGSDFAETYKTPATSFAVADVEVCPKVGPVTVLWHDFHVVTSDNRQWGNFISPVGTRVPPFAGDLLPAGLCSRGWIAFQVGDGSTVSGILYTSGHYGNGASPISEQSIVWQP